MALLKNEIIWDYASDWEIVLSAIKAELPYPASYDSYFKKSEFLRVENGTAIIALASDMHVEIVEANYSSLILQILKKETSHSISTVAFEAKAELLKMEPRAEQRTLSIERTLHDAEPTPTEVVNFELFYPEYTFDRFVQDEATNSVAFLSSIAVAEAPGKTPYNPLIIYGNTGLGKTHLLQAIGHYAKNESTVEKAYYITALDFLSRFVENRGDVHAFIQEFHDVDLLLVDDIQFFSKKPGTQKQFLAIFSKLINSKKQIVLTSDRHPEQIPDMEERLISQLKGGLKIDIQPPTLETRLAILQQKAKSDNIQLSDEVMTFIASQETSNVRALEGIFTKVLASSIFANRELDLDTVKELLTDFRREQKERITVELIQEKVANYFNISSNQLRAHTRIKTVSYPRNIAMYLSRQLTKHTLQTIGLQFGNRDYSTVIHACKKIDKDLEVDEKLRKEIDHIIAEIQG